MSGFLNIVKYRLIIMYKSKTMIGLTVIVIGLFALLMSTLYSEADEDRRITVAVVDQDQTAMTGRILKHLEDDTILHSMEISESEAMTRLKQDKVQAVYVLKDGLEEHVKMEKDEDIIDVYYLKGNTISKFIGDLFAEKVLRDLCLIKSVHLLDRAMDQHQMGDHNKDMVLKKAFQTGLSMQDYSDHQYYVQVEFIKDNMNIESENIDKSILYKKMILGMILSFIAFYIIFASIGIVKDRETHLESRLRVTSTHPIGIILGQYLSLMLSGGLVSIIFGILSFVQGENFIQTTLILLLFVMSISAMVLFFAHVVPTVGNHMLILSIIILIMGVMSGSFFSIDVITSGLKNIAYMIPHYLTMNALIDNLALGHEAVVPDEYIGYCLLYSAILLVVTCMLNHVKKSKLMNLHKRWY